jgi:hypothetical protein
MKDYLEKYITSMNNLHLICDKQLLRELIDYKPSIGHKAQRIYVKCIARKKYTLAKKIERKYGHLFVKDDFAIAMAYTILATK